MLSRKERKKKKRIVDGKHAVMNTTLIVSCIAWYCFILYCFISFFAFLSLSFVASICFWVFLWFCSVPFCSVFSYALI